MILIHKNTPEFEFKLTLVLPSFHWRKSTITFNRKVEESTKLIIPVEMGLTLNKDYVIVKFCLGIGFELILIEKQQ